MERFPGVRKAYQDHAKQEMDKIEKDLKDGRIDQRAAKREQCCLFLSPEYKIRRSTIIC